MTSELINVYELVKPEVIVKYKRVIAETLFKMKSLSEDNKSFRVSPASGCIFFSDNNKLWKATRTNSLPPNMVTAKGISQRFLVQANRALMKSPRINKAELPQLFPTTIRHLDTKTVFNSESGKIDHWLSQFMVFLPLGTTKTGSHIGTSLPLVRRSSTENISQGIRPSESVIPAVETMIDVPVIGSCIDIRIGSGGEIIGLWSQWRPYKKIIRAEKIAEPKVNSGNMPILYYPMEGDEEPQRFIAPNYLVISEGHYNIFPASSYSLVIHIEEELIDHGNKVRLIASVVNPDGSTSNKTALGQIRYTWNAWRIDEGLISGLQDYGTSNTIDLKSGAYNVILVVENFYGSIASTQALVYTRNRQITDDQFEISDDDKEDHDIA